MDQLDLPFALDQDALATFLTRAWAIKAEEERLREDMRLLREEYAATLPLRALMAAVKIVDARRKLEAHPKEPMSRLHLNTLCVLVEQHLDGEALTLEAIVEAGSRVTVNTQTGEVLR